MRSSDPSGEAARPARDADRLHPSSFPEPRGQSWIVSCSTSFFDSATASDLALPATPRLPMYLILVSGGMTGSMFRLSPGENRLGRAPG